ncbi:hypothetical protein [Devosia yakushimensis]|nr:hypothetical protein [Devosia yakushimensis]
MGQRYNSPMIRVLTSTIVLILAISAATAAECRFMDQSGAELVQQPGALTVLNADGSVDTTCQLKGNGPGNPVMTGLCDDGFDWPYFMIAATPSEEPSIAIFINTAWYPTGDCR